MSLKNQYQSKGIAHDVVNAVIAKQPDDLVDFDHRVKATEQFKQQEYAKSLVEANKRARNIIAKSSVAANQLDAVDEAMFESPQEHDLAAALAAIKPEFQALVKAKDYQQGYALLATLADPLDQYFEHVMVNADDEQVRCNRLSQLAQFSQLTNAIADLSELVKS